MPSTLPQSPNPARIIRPAEERDRPALEAIAQAAYALYLDRMPDGQKPFPMLDDYGEHIRRGRAHVLADGDDGEIVGYVVCMPKEPGLFLLDNIAVLPGRQKSGYGRALVRYAEEAGRKQGFRRICLYTNAAMTENLAWYPRLGYRVSHRLVENGYDRVYFVKEL